MKGKDIDILNISTLDLRRLLDEMPLEIQRREKQEKASVRQELEKIAALKGYSLEDLLGSQQVKAPKSTKRVAIKYRSPSYASLSWTGRGRQPKWVIEFLSQGGTLEQLAV